MTAALDTADPLLSALSSLPAVALLTGDAVGEGYGADMSVVRGVRPGIVLRPGSTADLSRMLAACHALGRPVVVQGGRSGLAGGASPCTGEVALSLERMRRLGVVDALGATVIAEAGVPLQTLQEVGALHGLRFPIDLGARGSATVGGMIATNAGGIRVVGHGMMRQHVLGLEVVLADGTLLSRLGTLAKDNSGPDLKQLFIGSEGTLGVVARAVLALTPRPAFTALAFGAVPGIAATLEVLRRVRARLGRLLSAFEFIDRRIHAEAVAFGAASPLPPGAGGYSMIEIEGATEADRELFEAVLAEALADGLLTDVVLAGSGRDEAAFWRFRDDLSACVFAMTDTHGFDIGVPPGLLAGFLAGAEAAILAVDPLARFWIFGHLGDGNLHYIVTTSQPQAVADIVYRLAARAGGALSAEHGIGREKTGWLAEVRSAAEIAQMRRLKAAFDPQGILNPGRVLPPEGSA
jgi:FAD/FMN-containing dehydrogenase